MKSATAVAVLMTLGMGNALAQGLDPRLVILQQHAPCAADTPCRFDYVKPMQSALQQYCLGRTGVSLEVARLESETLFVSGENTAPNMREQAMIPPDLYTSELAQQALFAQFGDHNQRQLRRLPVGIISPESQELRPLFQLSSISEREQGLLFSGDGARVTLRVPQQDTHYVIAGGHSIFNACHSQDTLNLAAYLAHTSKADCAPPRARSHIENYDMAAAVKLYNPSGNLAGTATAIGSDLLLTANHVRKPLAPSGPVTLRCGYRGKIEARLVLALPEFDLAVLRAECVAAETAVPILADADPEDLNFAFLKGGGFGEVKHAHDSATDCRIQEGSDPRVSQMVPVGRFEGPEVELAPVSDVQSSLASGICDNDSGSPVVVQTTNDGHDGIAVVAIAVRIPLETGFDRDRCEGRQIFVNLTDPDVAKALYDGLRARLPRADVAALFRSSDRLLQVTDEAHTGMVSITAD